MSSVELNVKNIIENHGTALLAASSLNKNKEDIVFRLTEKSLHRFENGIPAEYRGAELPPKLYGIIRDEPVSIALIGPPGTGKTYLLWSIVRHDRQIQVNRLMDFGEVVDESERPSSWLNRVVDRVCQDSIKIISESRDIRRNRHDRDWLDGLARWHGLLCVDDIGFTGKADDWVVESIYHIANERRAHGRKTMWTTNLSADELRTTLGAAVASRILGGAVVPVTGQDRRLL